MDVIYLKIMNAEMCIAPYPHFLNSKFYTFFLLYIVLSILNFTNLITFNILGFFRGQLLLPAILMCLDVRLYTFSIDDIYEKKKLFVYIKIK